MGLEPYALPYGDMNHLEIEPDRPAARRTTSDGGVPIAGGRKSMTTQRPPGLAWYVAEHPALLVSLLAAAAVVGKVLLAARGDIETAVALVSAGIPQILLGVAIIYAPVLTIYLVAVALWWNARRRTAISGLSLTVAAVAMAYLVPLGVIGLVVIGAGSIYVGARLVRQRPGSYARWAGRLGLDRARLMDWLVVWSLAALVFGPGVWLPPESLTVAGAPAFTGYVVDEEDLWATVLRDDTRTIIRVAEGELTDRRACETPGTRWLSMPQLWNAPVPLPACP